MPIRQGKKGREASETRIRLYSIGGGENRTLLGTDSFHGTPRPPS
jgi:hypothetical protein